MIQHIDTSELWDRKVVNKHCNLFHFLKSDPEVLLFTLFTWAQATFLLMPSNTLADKLNMISVLVSWAIMNCQNSFRAFWHKVAGTVTVHQELFKRYALSCCSDDGSTEHWLTHQSKNFHWYSTASRHNIIFILIKSFIEPSCPVDGNTVILEEYNRIEMFQQIIKVISLDTTCINLTWLVSLRRQMDPNHASKMPPTGQHSHL